MFLPADHLWQTAKAPAHQTATLVVQNGAKQNQQRYRRLAQPRKTLMEIQCQQQSMAEEESL
jgi:hypothetical protein